METHLEILLLVCHVLLIIHMNAYVKIRYRHVFTEKKNNKKQKSIALWKKKMKAPNVIKTNGLSRCKERRI